MLMLWNFTEFLLIVMTISGGVHPHFVGRLYQIKDGDDGLGYRFGFSLCKADIVKGHGNGGIDCILYVGVQSIVVMSGHVRGPWRDPPEFCHRPTVYCCVWREPASSIMSVSAISPRLKCSSRTMEALPNTSKGTSTVWLANFKKVKFRAFCFSLLSVLDNRNRVVCFRMSYSILCAGRIYASKLQPIGDAPCVDSIDLRQCRTGTLEAPDAGKTEHNA